MQPVTETIAPAAGASRRWLLYATLTTAFWGVWGAFIEITEKHGFPATLGYCVWALTMLPCAAVALRIARWQLEGNAKQIGWGLAVGLTGAGGQLILFEALRIGPAYLVFPIISLYPVLTVVLAYALLRERARRKTWMGVLLSFPAIAMLAYQPPGNGVALSIWWLPLAAAVFALWGVQAYCMKFATGIMQAESLFFYMAISAVALIPGALWMTDFSHPVNWHFSGPWLAALIQVLNSAGALMLVYAMRYGKAMVVAPMTALAPVITVLISLLLYRLIPDVIVIAGMVLATAAIVLMAE